MKKLSIKKEKGITLIALAVTIAVLVILASIGIRAALGDEGIIKRAEDLKLQADYNVVKTTLETYKIQKELVNETNEEITDERLIGSLYKKVFVDDTKRELAVIVDFKEMGVEPTYGQGGEKILKDDDGDKTTTKQVDTIYTLGNIYAIDLADGSLYYINGDQIYTLDGERVEVAENETVVEKYEVETFNETYIQRRKFITKWNVTLGEEEGSETYSTVVLPAQKDSTYNATIYWGDGTSTLLQHKSNGVTLTDAELIEKVTHNYTLAENDDGIRIIEISGTYEDFRMGTSTSTPTKLKLIGLEQWGNVNIKSFNFSKCTNLKGIIPNYKIEDCFSNCYSLHEAFLECSNLQGIDNDFKIPSTIKSMQYTFFGCSSLTSLPDNFTIPKGVSNMDHTFSNCSSLSSLPEQFTIPEGVTNMSWAFWRCSSLTSLPDNFTIPQGVTNMGGTFNSCGITSLPTNFTIPEGVTNMDFSFTSCGITRLPENFKLPSTLTNMYSTFAGCGLATLPNDFAIPEGVTNIGLLFNGCRKLEGVITIKANPTSYGNCFHYTGQNADGTLTVNYTSNCTNIDDIIASGLANKVVKGSLVE